MRTLVIGGAGYIGSHTCVELLQAGHQPVILDNLNNSQPGVVPRLEELTGVKIPFYKSDFQDSRRLTQILRDEGIDSVIHFAAYKAVGESVTEPLKYYGNNTADFVRLLQTLTDAGIGTVIFSSTAAVYGNPTAPPATEETVCAPESPYGWSKYMDEIILRDTCLVTPGLRGVALRYFNVVGAHPSGRLGEKGNSRPQSLLPVIINSLVTDMPLTILGGDYATPDGTCQRDYIHVVDLAKAHVAALQPPSGESSANYEVYNIATGEPTSVLEMIEAFEEANGVKVAYKIGARRAGDPAVSYASAAKAERQLAWKAEKSIKEACADAWRWQTNNPDGYGPASVAHKV